MKKGEIFLRDYHGNFHKLEVSEILEEGLDAGLNNEFILSSDSFTKSMCNDKKHFYYKLNLKNVKNSIIKNDKFLLDHGLFRFSIFLNIKSNYQQRIYSFIRDESIENSTLNSTKILKQIPNNINYNSILKLKSPNQFEFCVISELDIKSIESYIIYHKIN